MLNKYSILKIDTSDYPDIKEVYFISEYIGIRWHQDFKQAFTVTVIMCKTLDDKKIIHILPKDIIDFVE